VEGRKEGRIEGSVEGDSFARARRRNFLRGVAVWCSLAVVARLTVSKLVGQFTSTFVMPSFQSQYLPRPYYSS
jgi:hypothetical protein